MQLRRLFQKLSSGGGGRQNLFCPGGGGGSAKNMSWGWRGLKTCHVMGGGGGYFSARGEKFGNDNTVRGVNCVLRVEGVEKKICMEGGGGIEKISPKGGGS